MQYVKRVCGKIVFVSKFLVFRGEIKGSQKILCVNFDQKKIGSSREQFTSFPLVTLRCCCLPRKLQKERKFVASFVYKIDEIPAIFSNLRD